MFSQVPFESVRPGDNYRCYGLKGTVVKLVPHTNGVSYSIWLTNPQAKWVEDFEWIMWDTPLIYREGQHA